MEAMPAIGQEYGSTPFFRLPMTTMNPFVHELLHMPVFATGEILQSLVMFSEGDSHWQPLPPWAAFLIRVGYDCQATLSDTRRIILISMPCESAGAALVTLGALRRRLEEEGADDLAAHFDRIRGLVGTAHEQRGLCYLREVGKLRGPYFVEEFHEATGLVMVRHKNNPATRLSVSPGTAEHWRFEDEPPLQLHSGQSITYSNAYQRLVADAGPVRPDNLTRSDSVICLATRSSGEIGTRTLAAQIRLAVDGLEAGLAELLTVRQWSPDKISRIVLFNTRTGEPDRQTRLPRMVIADGDHAFLKALDNPLFRKADVIGVVPRTLERERLEDIGRRLGQLEQWYRRDDDTESKLEARPEGISVAALRKASV